MIEFGIRGLVKILVTKTIFILLYFLGIEFFSSTFKRKYNVILAYHRIIKEGSAEIYPYISISDYKLDEQLAYFKKNYVALSMDELVANLKSGTLPNKSVCFTFDDGYKDNLELGAPVLFWHKVPFTVYVTTACSRKNVNLWTDELRYIYYSEFESCGAKLGTLKNKISAIKKLRNSIGVCKSFSHQGIKHFIAREGFKTKKNPSEQSPLMMSVDDLKKIIKYGCTIGAHTENHMILSKCSREDAFSEIIQSKNFLDEHLNSDCRHFAYPNGTVADYSFRDTEIIRSLGFTSAVTTKRGVVTEASRVLELPRIGVYRTDSLIDLRTKIAIAVIKENLRWWIKKK